MINTWYEGHSALPHTRDWLLVSFRGMLFKSVDRDQLESIPKKIRKALGFRYSLAVRTII